MAALWRKGFGPWHGRSPLLMAMTLLGLGLAMPGVRAQGLGRPGPDQAPGAKTAADPGTSLGSPCPMGMGQGMGMGMSDQRFIAAMIPHHQGAIAMAELALRKAQRPEIRALAERIRSSQSKEIAQMSQWYQQWFGTSVPELGSYGPGPMAMGSPGMGMALGRGAFRPGMELTSLSRAQDFDRAFLAEMVSHHRMGVMMAAMAQVHARHPQLLDLEQAMVRVQSSEIQQMEAWARQWFGTP